VKHFGTCAERGCLGLHVK